MAWVKPVYSVKSLLLFHLQIEQLISARESIKYDTSDIIVIIVDTVYV